MQTTTTTRQARLKSGSADHYPSLPVSMWTSAATMAKLVAGEPGEERLGTDGILLEADFEFRDG